MAATRTVTRTLVVKAETNGAEKAATDLNKVGGAAQQAGEKIRTFERTLGAAGATVKETSGRMLSVEKGYDRLRKSIDPVYRETQRLAAAEKLLQRARMQGLEGVDQTSRMLQEQRLAYAGMGKAALAANQNVKLTSGQVQNLGYQVNDIATMLAMGASPFAIISSQAGQVVQALGDGPQGMRGSLKAIGTSIASLAAKWGPIGLAVGAVATATYLLWKAASGPEVKTAEESLERYKKLLGELENGYKRSAEAAKAFMEAAKQEGPNVARAALQGTSAEIQASLTREVETLTSKTQGFITSFKDLSPAVLAGQQRIRDLGTQLASNQITAAKFRDEIARLRIDPATPPVVRKIADDLLDSSVNARDLANALGAVGAAAAVAGDKFGRLVVPSVQDATRPFGGTTNMLGRMDPEGMDAIRDGLKAQTEAMKEATSVADDYRKSVTDRSQATKDSVVEMQLELKTIGMTTSEAAALRFEYQKTTEAMRAAAEAGQVVSPAEIAYIKEAAGRVGEFTVALEKAREEKAKAEQLTGAYSDLAFEREQIGRSPVDQQVFQQLRQLGVAYDSYDGQRIAGEIRYNDALANTRDQMEESRDLAKDFAETLVGGLQSGEGVLKSLTNAFAALGNKMASNGLNMVLDGLIGGGKAGGSATGSRGLMGALSSLGSLFNSKAPVAANQNSFQRTGATAALTASDFAASSGALMQYSSKFNSKVDSRLTTILSTAASRFSLPVTATSGYRPGDPRYHGQGLATDVAITGANGQKLGNYQDTGTFRVYEQFAQLSKQVQTELFPELNGMLRWGGYFSGQKGKYGALDTMHFDLAGNKVGMGGGSFANGLTSQQRANFPGIQSVGMSSNDNRMDARAVADGMASFSQKAATGAIPGVDAWSGMRTVTGGASAPQAPAGQAQAASGLGQGLQALGVGLGSFASAYESGSPMGGALSGFLGGLSTGNPIMAVAGGIAGLVGGPLIGKSATKTAMAQRKAA